jgi:hypothetical protein
LRSSEPALVKTDIVKEFLALEEVIPEAARKSQMESRSESRSEQSASTLPADNGKWPWVSNGGLARLLVVLIILGGVIATISWQWSAIKGLYQSRSYVGSKPQTQVSHETASAQLPEQSIEQTPWTALLGGQMAPAAASAVLSEEEPNDQLARRYMGSAIWHTEAASPGPGLAPELVVRADVEIPERRMTLTWSLRRNTDKTLPASHMIEIRFNPPADFPGGGIAKVRGISMKQAEQARGTPLAGPAVEVINGSFLIALSAVDADLHRNEQLLKECSWFDLTMVYVNGGRAHVATEKGPQGDRAFAEAFAAWESK